MQSMKGTNANVEDVHYVQLGVLRRLTRRKKIKIGKRELHRSEDEVDMFFAFKEYHNCTWQENLGDNGTTMHTMIDNIKIGMEACKIDKMKPKFHNAIDLKATANVIEVKDIIKFLATAMLFVETLDGLRRTFLESEPEIKDTFIKSLTNFQDLCMNSPPENQ